MNSINKVLSVSFLTLMFLKGVVVIILVWLFPLELASAFKLMAALASNNPAFLRLAVTSVAGLLVMLSLFVLLAVLSDETEGVIAIATENGPASMTLEALRQHIGESVVKVEAVKTADPAIHVKGSRVDVLLRVRLRGDADPSQATIKIHDAFQGLINRLGINPGELKISILPPYNSRHLPHTRADDTEEIIVPGATAEERQRLGSRHTRPPSEPTS